MADVKPGQSEAAGTPPSPPPVAATETVTPPPAAETQPPPTDNPPAVETPAAPTPERDAQGRFVKPEDRAKAGAEGGWMVHLRPEDREELKREPWRYSEMKAKLAAYEGQRAQVPSPATPPPPDPSEEYAERMSALASRNAASPMEAKDYYREEAKIREDFTRKTTERVASEQAQKQFSQMTEAQEVSYIGRQPEVQNPDFVDKMVGLFTRGGGRLSRTQAYEMTKAWFADKFPQPTNGTVKTAPVVAPALGEMRTTSQAPSQPSMSIYEKFARTPTGKAINDRGAFR